MKKNLGLCTWSLLRKSEIGKDIFWKYKTLGKTKEVWGQPTQTPSISSKSSQALTPTQFIIQTKRSYNLLDREGEQRHVARPLDSHRQLTLVKGAVARNPPGQYLAPLGDILAQLVNILIIDRCLAGTVYAETADLLFSLAAFSSQIST